MLRQVAAISLAALGLVGLPAVASAQAWPAEKPIRLIVPFPPGGGTDISARFAADYLSQKLGQAVVVENKPGAATAIGMDLVRQAKPDGYTLLWTTSDGMSILPAVKPTVPYKIPDDYTWVAGAVAYTLIVASNGKLPFNNLADMIAHAKANPGKLRYASSGTGAGGHLATALIANAAGVDMVHVPFQGAAPAVTSTVGGHTDLVLVATSSVKQQVEAGQLKALATTDNKRSPLFPNAPTLDESGLKGLSVILYYGMLAPAGTPEPIAERLRTEIGAMLKDPKILERIATMGFEPAFLPGNAFKDFMIKDLEKWKGVSKAANIVLTD
jgi:tripartite-type tricarboxylate transporter receptor subunit TctC